MLLHLNQCTANDNYIQNEKKPSDRCIFKYNERSKMFACDYLNYKHASEVLTFWNACTSCKRIQLSTSTFATCTVGIVYPSTLSVCCTCIIETLNFFEIHSTLDNYSMRGVRIRISDIVNVLVMTAVNRMH